MYLARRRGEYSAVLDCNVNVCVVDDIKSNASGSDKSHNSKACLLCYLGHWGRRAGVKWSNAPSPLGVTVDAEKVKPNAHSCCIPADWQQNGIWPIKTSNQKTYLNSCAVEMFFG